MNDLIINGIDHSKFDLEWSKRGGVVKTSVSEQPALPFYTGKVKCIFIDPPYICRSVDSLQRKRV